MATEANQLLRSLDDIIAEHEGLKAHLATSGAPLTVHDAHGDLMGRLTAFRAEFAAALDPKAASPGPAVCPFDVAPAAPESDPKPADPGPSTIYF